MKQTALAAAARDPGPTPALAQDPTRAPAAIRGLEGPIAPGMMSPEVRAEIARRMDGIGDRAGGKPRLRMADRHVVDGGVKAFWNDADDATAVLYRRGVESGEITGIRANADSEG